MKTIKFESGKTYGAWQHDLVRTVEKRTECYVWIKGCKRLIREEFLRNLEGELESIEYVIHNGLYYYACCDWDWAQK